MIISFSSVATAPVRERSGIVPEPSAVCSVGALLRHDPEYRSVRKEHLVEVGKRIGLKRNIRLLIRLLQEGIEGLQFSFYVISAAPEEVIQSALEGIVPPDRIYGTRFDYDSSTGEIRSILRVPAAVSEAWHVAQIVCRTVLSDDALSILVPILEDIAGVDPPRIRSFFEAQGLALHEWDKLRIDWVSLRPRLSIDPGELSEADTPEDAAARLVSPAGP
jgi:hypothetical protein